MKYMEAERAKQIIFFKSKQSEEFAVDGIYKKVPREFVLKNRINNLHESIRDDAISYFHDKKISWWDGGIENLPTGHMLSSQVACVNHLFPFRLNKELASEFLISLDLDFIEALPLDESEEDGLYLAFEKTAKNNLGGETCRKRGANSTSIDAFMFGKKKDGKKVLILIEWKYTENYQASFMRYSSKKTDRLVRYFDLLPPQKSDSPIKIPNGIGSVDHKDANQAKYPELNTFCFEPYYQLMRQTLLGDQMVRLDGYGADDYLHLHLIPKNNIDLIGEESSKIPLSNFGADLATRWKSCLNSPEKYQLIHHEDIFPKLMKLDSLKESDVAWLDYLDERYFK